MRSGRYVLLREKDSLKTIAKEFKTPQWMIETVNPGKKFDAGEWIFVPLKRGFVGRSLSSKKQTTSVYLKSGDFIWPVPSSRRISSHFGKRWGKKHDGIDIAAKRGSHILATANGIVVYAGNKLGGYGNITVIGHRDGYFSVYAHADKNYTVKGQKVHKGQVIATVGSTGRSTGPHLHFELRKDSRSLNPQTLLGQN